MMKVTLTGTGSPIPDANRAGPSTLVQCVGQNILIDCGRGVAMRLVAAGVPALASRTTDILDYHSSVEDAAKTAARAGVKTLMLTHYVPAMQPGQEADWVALAAAHFSGNIVLGPDLTAAEA